MWHIDLLQVCPSIGSKVCQYLCQKTGPVPAQWEIPSPIASPELILGFRRVFLQPGIKKLSSILILLSTEYGHVNVCLTKLLYVSHKFVRIFVP